MVNILVLLKSKAIVLSPYTSKMLQLVSWIGYFMTVKKSLKFQKITINEILLNESGNDSGGENGDTLCDLT